MLRRIRWWLLTKLAGSDLVIIGAKIDGTLVPEGAVAVSNGKWRGPALLRPRNRNAELMWE